MFFSMRYALVNQAVSLSFDSTSETTSSAAPHEFWKPAGLYTRSRSIRHALTPQQHTHPNPYACATSTSPSAGGPALSEGDSHSLSRGSFLHSASTRAPPRRAGRRPTLWLRIRVSGPASAGASAAQRARMPRAVAKSTEISQLPGWYVPPSSTWPGGEGRGIMYVASPLDEGSPGDHATCLSAMQANRSSKCDAYQVERR